MHKDKCVYLFKLYTYKVFSFVTLERFQVGISFALLGITFMIGTP